MNFALVLSRKIDNDYVATGPFMNQPLLLHVVERLEGLIGKLPATIQKPILSELTPLKELFLQQRPPRLLFAGSDKMPLPRLLEMIFGSAFPKQPADTAVEVYHWKDFGMSDHGTMSIFDARGADDSNAAQMEEELARQPADVIVFVDDGESARGPRKIDMENLLSCARLNQQAKIVALSTAEERAARIRSALEGGAAIRERLLNVFPARETKKLMSILARELPNQARIEMIRVSRDKDAQHEVAQVLVKSTTAICTAIGAQPIPLADMPILTTLQLVMVSGIMYISGRERSLRAATEFVGAIGANVGAGMLLREGTRAILKFFPGWGNLISGAVAGAGTYSIGRAAEVFFLEGVSLKDARRTYIKSRKKPLPPELPAPRQQKKRRTTGK